MRYFVLTCDYDGTLARDGIVSPETIAALEEVKASGRKLILATGRFLEDLQRAFSRLDLFNLVIAENGGILYRPADETERVLGERPSRQFIQALEERGVSPLVTGRVLVASWHPNEEIIIEVINELGLERQVIFNKGAVMVLPSGVNKGTGLAAALHELKFSPHNVVAVGDAENDHSLLTMSECSVAVANALPSLKEEADYTTKGADGEGVTELIRRLLTDDLKFLDEHTSNHVLKIGTDEHNQPVFINARRVNALIAGASGSGKSTLVTALLEQLVAEAYQFCLIDPEGDYETFQNGISLGNTKEQPITSEIVQLLEKSEQSAILNLLAISIPERPNFFRKVFPTLREVQSQVGHPQWFLTDEAHHLLPPETDTSVLEGASNQFNMLFITNHPRHLARQVLDSIDVVIGIGTQAAAILQEFGNTVGQMLPKTTPATIEESEALVWFRHTQQAPLRIKPTQPSEVHQRHRRKYAEGDLGKDISFYFRGPEGKLNLRAQNLNMFSQIAQGVDDATWLYHLHQGDYSRWFRDIIKDPVLAAEAEQVRKNDKLTAKESRDRILGAIAKRYTLSA